MTVPVLVSTIDQKVYLADGGTVRLSDWSSWFSSSGRKKREKALLVVVSSNFHWARIPTQQAQAKIEALSETAYVRSSFNQREGKYDIYSLPQGEVDSIYDPKSVEAAIPYEVAVASAVGHDVVSAERIADNLFLVWSVGGKFVSSRRVYAPDIDVSVFMEDINQSVKQYRGSFGRVPDFVSTNLGKNIVVPGVEVRHVKVSAIYESGEIDLESCLVTKQSSTVSEASPGLEIANKLSTVLSILLLISSGAYFCWRIYENKEMEKQATVLAMELDTIRNTISNVRSGIQPPPTDGDVIAFPKSVNLVDAVKHLSRLVNLAWTNEAPIIKSFVIRTDQSGTEYLEVDIEMDASFSVIKRVAEQAGQEIPGAQISPTRSGFSIRKSANVGSIYVPGLPGMNMPIEGTQGGNMGSIPMVSVR